MGTPQSAATGLGRLVDDGNEIVAVYTQPDRPSGRGKKITFSPVKELALKNNLQVLQPTKIKTPPALAEFKSYNADVAVVIAYGRILPEGFLTAFPSGAINVHFSLLPKYRGAAPVNWAIVNGETETGVTTMKMNMGLDTGDILLQESIRIGPDETAPELLSRLSIMGASLISRTLAEISHIQPVKQDDARASFAPILKKEDGLIDWLMSAVKIERRVRGFQPFPSSYTFHSGHRLTIWRAEPLNEVANRPAAPGTILEATGDRLTICCGNNSLLAIKEIQPEGKRRMSVRDFLNGGKLKVGDFLDRSEQSTIADAAPSKSE